MLSKVSVDQVFTYRFQNIAVYVGFAPNSHRGSTPGTAGGLASPMPPNLPNPGKNPAGAHAAWLILLSLAWKEQAVSIPLSSLVGQPWRVLACKSCVKR